MKIITVVIGCFPFILSGISNAQEIYKVDLPSTQIGSSTITYAKADRWHIKCRHRPKTMKYIEGWWCDLAEITGEKGKGRHGVFKTLGNGLEVKLTRSTKKPLSVEVRVGYRVQDNSTVRIMVGDKMFEKIFRNRGQTFSWKDSEVAPIIRAFIKDSVARYKYISPGDRKQQGPTQQGKTSLIGFTKAWDFAANFVVHDPMKSSEQ